ncbi:MAG: FAD-binding domain-containing protein, partial [Actinomycetota bacterium]
MTTAASTRRPLPPRDGEATGVTRWVIEHLGHLVAEDPAEAEPSPRFRGGQRAADRALAALDVTGYAANRNEAYPTGRRAASGLSPYIRHGLLTLPQVWAAVAGGPDQDVSRFRDELLWQEYARHWYARLGPATASPQRHLVIPATETALDPDPADDATATEPDSDPGTGTGTDSPSEPGERGWDEDMACLELTIGELEDDGWLVNQTRMWLASHWTVRLGRDWAEGEDYFFRHLLDGSRAANRLGWQWVTGAGSNRAYGFSRWQVERRAPGLCADCELGSSCPIDRWPDDPDLDPLPPNPLLATDPDPAATGGPAQVERTAPGGSAGASAGPGPDLVWLTAESLGTGDPALAANPNLPAVFVFDERLLATLKLSAKRLIFLAETLAELGQDRELTIHLGDPTEVLAGRRLATTFAPVPGWRRRAA